MHHQVRPTTRYIGCSHAQISRSSDIPSFGVGGQEPLSLRWVLLLLICPLIDTVSPWCAFHRMLILHKASSMLVLPIPYCLALNCLWLGILGAHRVYTKGYEWGSEYELRNSDGLKTLRR